MKLCKDDLCRPVWFDIVSSKGSRNVFWVQIIFSEAICFDKLQLWNLLNVLNAAGTYLWSKSAPHFNCLMMIIFWFINYSNFDLKYASRFLQMTQQYPRMTSLTICLYKSSDAFKHAKICINCEEMTLVLNCNLHW